MIHPGLEALLIIEQKRHCLLRTHQRVLKLFLEVRKRLGYSTIGLLNHGVTPQRADIKGYLEPGAIRLIRMCSPLHEHWHDHMHIVVHTNGADCSGARGGGEFQGDLGLGKDRQDIGKISYVEGDFGLFSID